jgi:predicted HicB family RNase H-like nuclease
MNTDHYTYRVSFSAEDGEFVGTCAEFPSLSWIEKDAAKAFSGIRVLVKDVVADMKKAGEAPPEPLATKKFSGRFVLRMPTELHRTLAVNAAEQGVSLNTYALQRLTRMEGGEMSVNEDRATYRVRPAKASPTVRSGARKRVGRAPA